MQRDTQARKSIITAIAVVSLAASGLAGAHPGVADHAPVNGPLHGLVHALMGAPAAALGTMAALAGLWSVARLVWRGAGSRAWQKRTE